MEGLEPFTNYSVRLGGVNAVGPGAWSELMHFRTEVGGAIAKRL